MQTAQTLELPSLYENFGAAVTAILTHPQTSAGIGEPLIKYISGMLSEDDAICADLRRCSQLTAADAAMCVCSHLPGALNRLSGFPSRDSDRFMPSLNAAPLTSKPFADAFGDFVMTSLAVINHTETPSAVTDPMLTLLDAIRKELHRIIDPWKRAHA